MENNILESFKKVYETSKQANTNDELPKDFIDTPNFDKEKYRKELEKLRSNENDMEIQYNKFHQTYIKMTEEDLSIKKLISDNICNISVRHAYCPNCGAELISKFPVIFNPYTGEKIAKYDCECGFKANLEYAYPRMIFTDNNGNEIKVFND